MRTVDGRLCVVGCLESYVGVLLATVNVLLRPVEYLENFLDFFLGYFLGKV